MRTSALAVLALLWGSPARADTLAAGDFLNLPVDVRSLGMGEASQAVAEGVGAISVNPSAIDSVAHQQFYFTHAFRNDGIGFDYLGYALAHGPHHFALSYQHLGYGSLNGRDAAGGSTVDFGPGDTAYGFTYGTALLGADVAGTIKYVNSKILNTAETMTFDLGARYKLGADWVIGLTGKNLIGDLKYEKQNFPLPTQVAAGVGWRAADAMWLTVDVVNPIYSAPYAAIGSEYSLPLGRDGALALRVGINTKTPDQGFVTGIKAGIGYRYKSLDIDYAFSPGGDLADSHHLGIGYRFGKPEVKEKVARTSEEAEGSDK